MPPDELPKSWIISHHMSADIPTVSSIDSDRSVSSYQQMIVFVLSELADVGKVEPSRDRTDSHPRTVVGHACLQPSCQPRAWLLENSPSRARDT